MVAELGSDPGGENGDNKNESNPGMEYTPKIWFNDNTPILWEGENKTLPNQVQPKESDPPWEEFDIRSNPGEENGTASEYELKKVLQGILGKPSRLERKVDKIMLGKTQNWDSFRV